MAKKESKSTQHHLPIMEIKENMVVLKNGSVRAVIIVSSINFALKSQDEQKALISGYVDFLNSLDFPLQITIQSRNLNIDGYLNNLKNIEKQQTNELLRLQIADYHNFLSELLELGQIMTKKFYVTVPYSGIVSDKKKFWERITNLFAVARVIKLSKKRFEEYQEELNKRLELVMAGLSGLGLAVVPLDTQSLIELFYNSYNPEIADTQKMVEVDQLRVEK